jgi:hypothetical protein
MYWNKVETNLPDRDGDYLVLLRESDVDGRAPQYRYAVVSFEIGYDEEGSEWNNLPPLCDDWHVRYWAVLPPESPLVEDDQKECGGACTFKIKMLTDRFEGLRDELNLFSHRFEAEVRSINKRLQSLES